MAKEHSFEPLFKRWASRVRARLALRHMLTGAALGAILALVPAGLAWKMRQGKLRPYAALTVVGGFLAGALVAYRRRWTDETVALYLDGELASEEAIATAVELEGEETTDPAMRAVVLQSATSALGAASHKQARPTWLRPVHLLLPLGLAGVAYITRAPLPPAPFVATDPGTTKIQLAQVDGLEKVIKLAELDPRDEAQRERLEKIARDAEKLKEDLNKGLEKRDAQDRIAKLKEQIAAERLTLGDGQQRAGLESAVSKLEENDQTKQAAKALGDHNLESMDAEMEKLANSREKQDRDLAKKSVQDAADAARRNGAPDVAKALEDEKKAMEKREKRAQGLRDLADAMKKEGIKNDGVENQSEALDRKGTDEAAKKLSDAMGKAMDKLTPEEKKRLADRLRDEAKKGGGQSNPEDLKDMADQLSTPEGQKKLEDQLKDMAKDDDEPKESKRQKGLDDAQGGADGTEKDIGKQKGQQGEQGGEQGEGQQGQQGQGQQGQGQQGQGQQGQGQGQQGQGQQGQGQGQGQQGQGQGQGLGLGQQGNQQGGNNGEGGNAQNGQSGGPGSHDVGTGNHAGSTNSVDAETLKARAHGHINKAQGMPGSITTTAQGRAGGTANVRGSGDLKVVGPSEVDGVERSDVPQEYREQVRQYFQP